MSRILNSGNNRVTQTYNQHKGWAKGIDIVKTPGHTDTIVSHSAGTVIKIMKGQTTGSIDNEGFGYGNYAMILHEDNYVTVYAHLKDVYVNKGQIINKGQAIGFMGNTGNSYGAHLHFEVRKYNENPKGLVNLHDTAKFDWVDPTKYIDSDLPISNVSNSSKVDTDYANSTIANRFKVKVNSVQKGAFTSYTGACTFADNVGGVVIDGLTGNQIYEGKATEDYSKSTFPNRFRVWVDGKQIGAYTYYNGAVSTAKAKGGVVLDGSNAMKQLYP